MNDNETKLDFIADTSGAERGFDVIEDGFDDMARVVQRAGGAIDSFFSELKSRFVITAGDVVNALGAVVRVVGEIPDAIGRGAAIDDVTSSFENLADRAGSVGDVLIGNLSEALSNTIPKVELMQKANDLLLGGLKPDQIELVAKAARTLGEVTGTNAAQGMDQLSDSLLRGNDRALKTLGIVVDNEKALESYAKSLGRTKDALNEQQKVEALRIASLEALAENTEKLGRVTDDAGDIIEQIKTSFRNMADEALKSLANNEDLNEALRELRDTIADTDFTPFINGLKDIVTFSVKAAEGLLQLAGAIAEAFDTRTTPVKIVDAQLDEIEKFRKSLGSLSEAVGKAQSQADLDRLKGKFEELGKTLEKSKNLQNNYTVAFLGLNEGANRLYQTLPKVKSAQEDLNKSTEKGSDADKEKADRLKEVTSFLEKYRAALQKQRDEVLKITLGTDDYQRVLADLRAGLVNGAVAGDRIKVIYGEVKAAQDELNIATEVYNGLLDAVHRGQLVASSDLATAADNLDKARQKVEGLGDAVKGAKGGKDSESGGFLTGLLGNFSSDDEKNAQLAGQEVGGALLDGLAKALSGEELSKTQIGETIGSGIGGAIGAYFGGPAGAQIGSTIGTAIGGGLAEAFGSRETQGKVRDSLDRMFVEALKDNPLLTVIDGQLQKISDLDFFRGTDKFTTGAFDDVFQGLGAAAQQAFGGIAEGFSEVFGQGSDLSTQLAAVLADNLGGSLNSLQLLVESTGKSFEDLKEATVEAFLDGKLSALEAQSALNGIAQVAQKGIPDGLGMVSTAFDNIKGAGTKGGRALVDALQDVGYEAKELGLKDFPAIMANLTATGKYSKDEIQQVFDALKASGIDSIDELTAATAEQLLPALAQLENTKFPFAEQLQNAKELVDTFDKLPTSKDVQVNVKVNYQNSADQAVVQEMAGRGQFGQGNATV